VKTVLAICASPPSLQRAFRLVERRATIIFCATPGEIAQIRTLDDLGVYDLIVISPIYWRVPTTSRTLAAHLRARFTGPIVAIGDTPQWRKPMKDAGCDPVIRYSDETALLIRELLFPSTPT